MTNLSLNMLRELVFADFTSDIASNNSAIFSLTSASLRDDVAFLRSFAISIATFIELIPADIAPMSGVYSFSFRT